MNFTYHQPTRLIFGVGSIDHLPSISKRYGRKCLLVGPYQNDAIAWIYEKTLALLSAANINVVPFLRVDANPKSTTVKEALTLAEQEQIDFVLAVGGGSSIDVGKLVASCFGIGTIDFDMMFEKYSDPFAIYPSISETHLPLIAVPTTSGTGSQFTQAAVITNASTQMKLTVYHPDHFAKEAIVDPQFMMSLPKGLTASTAFDAFTHAFEPFLYNDSNPITQQLALKAIENIVQALPNVLQNNHETYREALALADCYAGICLANGGAALPHPVSEIIGSYVPTLAHGQALALCYPAFLKHTASKYQSKFATVCRIFDASYVDQSDEVASQEFHLVMTAFLKKINLYDTLNRFEVSASALDNIRSCEIFQYLKMETQEVIQLVLEDTLGRSQNETY